MHSKSPRVTMAVEIEKTVKKNAFPEPASYKPSTRVVQNRTLGCFNFKCDRSGYLEEAGLIGKQQAPFVDKNYSQVDRNPKYPKIYNPAPVKPVEKVNLSPTSYNFDESYKTTQLKSPNSTSASTSMRTLFPKQ